MFFKAAILAAFTTLVAGAALDVWDPPVTSPHEGTTWTVGTQVNVTWDTSTKPAQVTNPIGTVFLVTNEVLETDHPLATGFPLTQGFVTVTVPNEVGTHKIVLFGDSGNESENFQIEPAF